MALQSVKNYVYVIVSGLVIVAGVLLILLQWGNTTHNFSLYGKTSSVNPALLMLCPAGGGVVLWYLGKLFLAGGAGIWQRRREKRKLEKMAERAAGAAKANDGAGAKGP